MFGKLNAFRQEAALQRRNSLIRVAFTADEDIQRRVITLGPSVDRHMAFRQYQYARNATIRGEMMEMPVQHGGAGRQGPAAGSR